MVPIILTPTGKPHGIRKAAIRAEEDTPLSERGIRQGMACAEGLKDIHIDRAISSPPLPFL